MTILRNIKINANTKVHQDMDNLFSVAAVNPKERNP
jgi:hypothetical protein